MLNFFHYYSLIQACYTFDAGPNACVFLLEEHVTLVARVVAHFFPAADVDKTFFQGQQLDLEKPAEDEQLSKLLEQLDLPVMKGALHYVISTGVGSGPAVLEESQHLLIAEGLPK